MKKLVYTLVLMLFISLITVSCTKENINDNEQLLQKQLFKFSDKDEEPDR